MTEYRLLARRCAGCRRRTWAPLPQGCPGAVLVPGSKRSPHSSRGRAAFTALLGTADPEAGEPPPPRPAITSDRYSAYGHLPPGQRSLCWAHLARDFRPAQDRGGIDAVVGRWVLELLGKLLSPWRPWRAGELTREQLLTAVAPHQEALRTSLSWGRERGTRALRALCDDLLAHRESLWTWLHVEDGEPTNNAAERVLRSAVLWRKNSFGHQSETGEQFVERMLPAVTTLRLQRRNLWDYLVQTCENTTYGRPAPSLLPQAPV